MTIFRPGGRSLNEQTRKLGSGKKVYAQGSFAPTKGRVNPSGYIQREIKKRGMVQQSGFRAPWTNGATQNKPSQSRSGLAAQAISRQPPVNSNQPPRNPVMIPGRQPLGPTPSNPGSPVGNPGGGQGFDNGPTPYTPPNYVNINTNGQLDLPFDESFSWDLISQKQNMNQSLQDLFEQEQQQGLEYLQTKRNASKDFEDLQRDTLNDAAGRGMAFSSLYGNKVARNTDAYNTFLGDLEAGNSLFKGNILRRRGGIENAFNEMLRQQALERALQLDDDAGYLGYDETPVDPSYDEVAPESGANKPITKPKPKPQPQPKPQPKPKPKPKPQAGRPGNHKFSPPKKGGKR